MNDAVQINQNPIPPELRETISISNNHLHDFGGYGVLVLTAKTVIENNHIHYQHPYPEFAIPGFKGCGVGLRSADSLIKNNTIHGVGMSAAFFVYPEAQGFDGIAKNITLET